MCHNYLRALFFSILDIGVKAELLPPTGAPRVIHVLFFEILLVINTSKNTTAIITDENRNTEVVQYITKQPGLGFTISCRVSANS